MYSLREVKIGLDILNWMADCLRAGKPSWYVTSRLDQLSLPFSRGRWIE